MYQQDRLNPLLPSSASAVNFETPNTVHSQHNNNHPDGVQGVLLSGIAGKCSAEPKE